MFPTLPIKLTLPVPESTVRLLFPSTLLLKLTSALLVVMLVAPAPRFTSPVKLILPPPAVPDESMLLPMLMLPFVLVKDIAPPLPALPPLAEAFNVPVVMSPLADKVIWPAVSLAVVDEVSIFPT